MLKPVVLLLPAFVVVAACSDINPYDNSKWEKAEEPISKQTNKQMIDHLNAAPKVDPSKPFAKSEDTDDWGASTPRD